MATVPSPRTWTTGETPTATELNTELRDAWNFFANPPRVKVYRASAQSVTGDVSGNSTDILMTWTSEIYDTDGMFSGSVGTPSSRLTVVTAGIYQVMLHVNFTPLNDSSPGCRYTAIKLNASGVADLDASGEQLKQIGNDVVRLTNSNTSLPQTSHVSLQMYLAQGDYIEACIGSSFNGGQNTLVSGAETRTFFGMRWMGVI